MVQKIRVGIFFGGASREREVSFAGGRTVYDNLDKSIFEAVPIFVDAKGKMIILHWAYIYKGTIRDFFPSEKFTKNQTYRVYAESLDLSNEAYNEMYNDLGSPIALEDLNKHIDFAFLVLHGAFGEDGSIQGLLEWLKIPYSGSRILSSAIGINKSLQKRWMENAGFNVPKYLTFTRPNLTATDKIEIKNKVGFPCVIKPANQGSSVGVGIAHKMDDLDKVFQKAWGKFHLPKNLSEKELEQFAHNNLKLNNSIGFPMLMDAKEIKHPEELVREYNPEKGAWLQSMQNESEVLVEAFIEGREFSAIVLENEKGDLVVLPPTEILKTSEIYNYDAKYLPGISRKKTPMEISFEELENLSAEVLKLYKLLDFNVYARIDGFLSSSGKIFLNDPNTTSGMMPSSFFFHQAAEVYIDPKNLISTIIRNSLKTGIAKCVDSQRYSDLMYQLKELVQRNGKLEIKEKVGVIMGGYSTERHISMESGRNIFEKLNSSNAYQAIPIFLRKKENEIQLYQLPTSYLLKDNADDISDKIDQSDINPYTEKIAQKFKDDSLLINQKTIKLPQKIEIEQLHEKIDFAFIALHGRPGEDGEIQEKLKQQNIPFNGSDVASSQLTINKFQTNNLLRSKGILVAENYLLSKEDWTNNKRKCLNELSQLAYPMIAKPVDEGCSSAVLKIKNEKELESYARLAFRGGKSRSQEDEKNLGLQSADEFPSKQSILCESFVEAKKGEKLIEITGGMLIETLSNGLKKIEIFEPSEVLSQSDILSLEEKFLAGEGQNITPARFSLASNENKRIGDIVKDELRKTAQYVGVEGYCRIDAFVKIKEDGQVEVFIIEVNSLPGMTPATCIYHQAAISGYKPLDFIQQIIHYGQNRTT